jgi:Protein of unknown function (DUF2778)
MWLFESSTGRLVKQGTGLLATGYSGAGAGKNCPTEENVQNVGPIPEGFFDMQAPVDSPEHGPYAIFLLPDVENTMFGRSRFWVHGDSEEHPGDASQGCIVMPRFAREAMWQGGDHRLRVVKDLLTKT